jgi:hypothetical protein
MTRVFTDDFTDEVLSSSQIDPSTLSPIERSLTALSDVLDSDAFISWQEEFATEHCKLFTLEGDLPPQAMKIYQEYVQSVEDRLLTRAREVNPAFDFDELLPVILEHKDDVDFAFANVFEVLNAALDFAEFRALMASYNRGEGLTLSVTTTKLDD